MQSVNIFSVDRPDGRLDVAQTLGSTGLMMFVYDLDPAAARARTTTSTRKSGSWSLTGRSSCAQPTVSTHWSGATSFASRPGRKVRTK